MKAKVTISKISNTKGIGEIAITINDKESGLRVVTVRMSLLDFADCITGLGNCDADYMFRPTEYTVQNIGKKREIKRVGIEKTEKILTKEMMKDYVRNKLIEEDVFEDGWHLYDDGTRSQQNTQKHIAVLVRYVPKGDA